MLRARHHVVFTTALGAAALAWNEVGLVGVWLPTPSADGLRLSLRRRWPQATETRPSGAIAEVADAVVRLLDGEHVGFASACLDWSDSDPFDRRVYEATQAIAAGEVRTYGDIAAQLGGAATARAVGQALGRNRWPLVVPCHRVVAAGHALGGFSAPGGTDTKRKLLAIERARRTGAPDLFDALA